MSGNVDKSKEWQLELLMEKLRSKAGQFKSFQEMSKNVRMAMLDKRYALDSVEKAQHQKCLDTLQHCIKVTSFQSMVERLESLTRQLGLKFMAGPSGVELFISSDMFYLEVILEPNERNGGVRDVKIHHEGKNEQQSCAELVHCLTRQDFADFTQQLEGLASIYQLNAEKKVKSKAFSALQALETDLNTLAQLQTNKDPFYLVHKSTVGILEKRRGGHPMKLTYMVSPYELIDTTRGRIEPLTVERVTSRKLGYSATVCIEGSTAHKLPIQPIVSINRSLNSTNGTPSYAPLTGQNSATIPACFTLRLSKQMCVCTVLAKRIQNITQLECGDLSTSHPLLSLITQHASDGQLDCANNRGLFVTLPDQQHCYFLTEGRNLQGVVINSVPFTSPKYVPSILALLRQQALFNTILSSCIRPNSKQDFENMIMFEINALSWQHLSISLEHPIEESMATADIDLTDILNITCKVYGPNNTNGEPCEIISEIATKVLQRCLSIPVTMRAIIKAWENMHESKKYINGNENFSLPLGSDDPGGNKNSNDSPLTDYGNIESKIKTEHSGNNGNSNMSNSSHQTTFLNDPLGFTNFSNAPANLDTNFNPTVITTSTSEKHYKKHKRKNKDDNWKSPKRKQGEDVDIYVAESSSSSDSVSTPLSQEATSDLVVSTPPSTLGFQSDFDLSGLDASELISSNEKNTLDFDCSNDNDLEDILSSNSRTESKPKKSKENRKSPMEVGDDTDKQQVAPSVSITPITTTPSTKYNFMLTEIERRPGIEIIPITSTSNTSLPSSITITPITSTQSTKSTSEERNRERKMSKSKSDDKSKLEKKRKRKREEDGMNPPDKVTVKQDPLTKPVSVSIKPTEILSLPASPSTKHSPSPSRSLSSSKQGSPSSKHSNSKTSNSLHHSGKNLSISSTKQASPGVSPKHPGASPKHSSTSGTGKPSMSTLKSATTNISVSSKSSDSSRTKPSKDPLKEKDKKTSSNSSLSGNTNSSSPTSNSSYSSANKIKTSSVKLKQLNLTCNQDSNQSDNLASPTSVDISKISLQGQPRNRKGSLSAIVDNLHKKSAQHCPESESGNSNKSGSNRNNLQSPKLDTNKIGSKNSETKNSEYMVKPSSDGMKITINKTRSKEAKMMAQNISNVTSNATSGNINNNPNIKISQSSTGNNSPKTHTGLKPGVNSGPASKKPQQLNQKSNVNSSCNSPTTKNLTSSTKTSSISRTNSGSLLGSSKSTTKLNNMLERNRDNKIRSSFGKSDKMLSGSRSSELRRSSPTIATRDEVDNDRSVKLHSKSDQPFPSHIMVEGLIKQTLDTKFQIPKLSSKNNTATSSTGSGGADDKKSIKSTNLHLENTVNNPNSGNKCDSPRNESTVHNLPIFTNSTEDKTKIMDASTTNKIVPTTSSLRLSFTTDPSHLQIANLTKTIQSPNHVIDDPKLKKDLLAITHIDTTNDDNQKLKSKFPVPISLPYSSSSNDTLNLSLNAQDTALSGKQSHTATELAMKVVTTTSQEVVEMLLDFSTSNPESITKLKSDHNLQSILPNVHHRSSSLPASPSVSVHIMKSPAQSPLIVPSPHSASSCITDDDLMDEALVGIGK